MLVIRTQQWKQFETLVLDTFVESCTQHVQRQHPAVAGRYEDAPALQEFVKSSLERAAALGFAERPHLQKFLDWECLFGPRFYELQQWDWLRAILHNGLDAAIRVYRIEIRLNILRQRGAL